MKHILIAIFTASMAFSCVSKKQLNAVKAECEKSKAEALANAEALQKRNAELEATITQQAHAIRDKEIDISTKDIELSEKRNRLAMIEEQLEYFRKSNTNLLERLADLSVVSKSGAESIQKSLEAINEQNKYIKDLTGSMQRKDSLNLVLVMNLKRSLADINDDDVQVEVRKGVVYISISDKLLFKSGSSDISEKAEAVLGKVAKVVNDHSELDILVEGHTDNVPISNACAKDNWDLSVKRATSVVRLLQTKYGVKPSRMTAGGRSEYVPKASNDTAEGKRINRRTEIIITPKLDQFFQLMQSKN